MFRIVIFIYKFMKYSVIKQMYPMTYIDYCAIRTDYL